MHLGLGSVHPGNLCPLVHLPAPPARPLSPPLSAQETSEDRRYHIVITAQGSAVHWQARVAYYWYKKVKAQCEKEGNCQVRSGAGRVQGEARQSMGEVGVATECCVQEGQLLAATC